jgi:hypothetical protein
MALTEKRELKSIQIHTATKTIDVHWVDQILRDGVVIGEPTNIRDSFGRSRKNEFLANFPEDGEIYVKLIGWDQMPDPEPELEPVPEAGEVNTLTPN